MNEILNITRALSDENRVRILMILTDGELCVCQIIELLGLAPSTVSKHMWILRQANLVQCRKDGRWMYYRLAGKNASESARKATEWLLSNLENDPKTIADRKLLKRLLKTDKKKLCKIQRQR